jgi:threonine dehydrogenase-like Zn-dependent dehydrogenase
MPSFLYLYKKDMKALTFRGKMDIRYEQVPDPEIKDPTDAIVKVNQTAICGSDLHIYHERESGLDAGTIMGHEFIGEIVALGKDVRNLKKGEMVASPFSTNCGTCYFCDIGLTARCTNGQLFGWVEGGMGLQGTQAEYVRVPYAGTTLVSIPEDLTPRHLLLSGDILSTGYFCADMAEINPGGLYVVIGCGPVGIMTIMSAFEQGALHIVAIDSIPARLELANRLGAIAVALNNDPVLNILEKTHGVGAEAVMEAVGSPVAQDLALKLVRPGGIISTVGVHTSDLFAFTPADAYNMNLTYRTGRCSARYYMDILLPKLDRWPFDLDMVISHELPLSEGTRAYEMFDRKEENCMKILLKP